MVNDTAWWAGVGLVAGIAACTVDPLASAGRPCPVANPCGPDAICASGVCVAASLDHGPVKDRVVGEGRRAEARSGDALPVPDLFSPDHPRPGDAGCPSGLTLCAGFCVNLESDASHCGACQKPCGAPQSDHCLNKTCVCGATGGLCPSGSVCAAGVCDSNPCLGKGDGAGCDDKLYCTVNDACKAGLCVGTSRDCSSASGNPCQVGTCDEALDQCLSKNALAGTPCGSGGQCYAGSCCTGCWKGSSCMAGKDGPACGTDGDLCQDCTTTECRMIGGVCDSILFVKCETIWKKSDGTACNGGACRDGGCCKGCWDGDGCRAGTHASACGPVGGLCQDCTSECRSGSTCTGGACTDPIKPDGTVCSGGKCHAGSCCKGCLSAGVSGSTTCQSGSSPSNCGVGAVACKTCPPPVGECRKATCASGSCGVGDAGDGTSCSGGECLNGSCCKGCISGSTCQLGTSASACGKGGVSCASCPSATPTCDASGSCV